VKVKGNIIKARLSFIKENYSAEALDRVLSSLSAEDQKLLRGIITSTVWIPFEVGKRLDAAIVKVLGDGKTEIFEELGRTSARFNLGSVHRSFLEPGKPLAFMEKAAAIYQFYYDVGRRTWEQTGPTSGILTTYDAETFSAFDCLTVIGWYKEALAMCGAKQISFVEELCRAKGDKVCRYRVSWS